VQCPTALLPVVVCLVGRGVVLLYLRIITKMIVICCLYLITASGKSLMSSRFAFLLTLFVVTITLRVLTDAIFMSNFIRLKNIVLRAVLLCPTINMAISGRAIWFHIRILDIRRCYRCLRSSK
jgi:hypothetical protein